MWDFTPLPKLAAQPWAPSFACEPCRDGALLTSIDTRRLEADLGTDALMPFRLRDCWLMFDASVVKEVLGVQQWLVVPNSSRGLLGLCAWRGRAIPVLDMVGLLGVSARGPVAAGGEQWQRTLIVECANNVVAVPVNEARAVVKVDVAARRPAQVTSLRFAEVEVDNGKEVMGVVDIGGIVRHLLGQVNPADAANGGAHAIS